MKLETAGKALFVTLEPCTRRGLEKVPCAVRVAQSGVGSVHIGTLDPNPQITGRGELFLSWQTLVERFPGDLARELVALNADFFGQHMHEHIPAVSPYIGGEETSYRPRLAGQREGLLQQSMDLITGSEGPVCMLAGGLSWLREMQIALLSAALESRTVRVLCSADAVDEASSDARKALISLGASVGIAKAEFATRGTITSPRSSETAMISLERSPALHGQLLRCPHDDGILDAASQFFELSWSNASVQRGSSIRVEEIPLESVRSILSRDIPAYAGASISIEEVPVEDLALLPRRLERFKLFRLSQLSALRARHGLPSAVRIVGSPWPIIPPIVERRPDGTLVVIDGAHRVYSAYTRHDESLTVVLVDRVKEPLPASPQPDKGTIAVGFERLPRSLRYDNLQEQYFRPIRAAFARAFSSLA